MKFFVLFFLWIVFSIPAHAGLNKAQRDELFDRVEDMCRDATNIGEIIFYNGSLDAGASLKILGIDATGSVNKQQWKNIEQAFGEFRTNITICKFEMIKLIVPLFDDIQRSYTNEKKIQETSWRDHECDYLVPALRFEPDKGVPLRGSLRMIPTTSSMTTVSDSSSAEPNIIFPGFDFSSSINSCRDAIRKFPNNGRYYYLLGVSHLMSGDKNSGMYYLDVAYKYNHSVAGAIIGLFNIAEDKQKSFTLIAESANSGFVDAMQLMIWFERNEVFEVPSSDLKLWAERAASEGDYLAMEALSTWGFKNMHNVSKDEAELWLRKSIMQKAEHLSE